MSKALSTQTLLHFVAFTARYKFCLTFRTSYISTDWSTTFITTLLHFAHIILLYFLYIVELLNFANLKHTERCLTPTKLKELLQKVV